MMLAYQPVRALATLNITIQQGLAGARNVLPIIDEIPEIKDEKDAKNLNVINGKITFESVEFNYKKNDQKILKNISWICQEKK